MINSTGKKPRCAHCKTPTDAYQFNSLVKVYCSPACTAAAHAAKATKAAARKPPASGKLRAVTKKASREPVISADTVEIVYTRCRGLCEACGKLLNGRCHLHHRRRRRDGFHGPSNIVALHPECHVNAPEAVHQRPAWARERGLIVRTTTDPAEAPLVLADGRTVRLSDDAAEYLPYDGTQSAA